MERTEQHRENSKRKKIIGFPVHPFLFIYIYLYFSSFPFPFATFLLICHFFRVEKEVGRSQGFFPFVFFSGFYLSLSPLPLYSFHLFPFPLLSLSPLFLSCPCFSQGCKGGRVILGLSIFFVFLVAFLPFSLSSLVFFTKWETKIFSFTSATPGKIFNKSNRKDGKDKVKQGNT